MIKLFGWFKQEIRFLHAFFQPVIGGKRKFFHLTAHRSRRFGQWVTFRYPVNRLGVFKAEWNLRRYRKKELFGFVDLNPSAASGVVTKGRGPESELRFFIHLNDVGVKDMTKVTHEEYFPNLTTERAFDALAEKYYGNHN
jgi:hypothetical protein